jgi:hypothetical protein
MFQCPAFEKLELLVKHGFIREAIPVIERLTCPKGATELSPVQSTMIAKYAIMCYTHQMESGDTTFTEEFRYDDNIIQKTILSVLKDTSSTIY